MSRAPAGRTFDACHGCGRVPGHYTGRPKTGVCEECAATLKLAQRAADEHRESGELTLYRLPTQSHWTPYIMYGRHSDDLEEIVNLQRDFWTLAIALSSPNLGCIQTTKDTKMVFTGKNDAGYDLASQRLMRSDIQAALDTLFQNTKKALVLAYAEGKERGTNMIAQLAAGEISVKQLNDFNLKG